MDLARRSLVDRIKRWLGIDAIRKFDAANKEVSNSADRAMRGIWDWHVQLPDGELTAEDRIARDRATERPEKKGRRNVG